MSGALVLRCKKCGQPLESLAVPMTNVTRDEVMLVCGCKKPQMRNLKWLKNHGLWPPIQSVRLPDKCLKCGAPRLLPVERRQGDRVTILRCGGGKDGPDCNAIYHLDNLTGSVTLMNPDD
jgi:hypothetical protein